MILIPFIAGWVFGSATLYIYMVATAKEPQNDECVDCDLPDCKNCPLRSQEESVSEKRAA